MRLRLICPVKYTDPFMFIPGAYPRSFGPRPRTGCTVDPELETEELELEVVHGTPKDRDVTLQFERLELVRMYDPMHQIAGLSTTSGSPIVRTFHVQALLTARLLM